MELFAPSPVYGTVRSHTPVGCRSVTGSGCVTERWYDTGMSDAGHDLQVPLRTAAEVGAFIRSAREEAQMTQAALAGELGVSRKWVSEVEQGKQAAEVGKVLAALLHLGFTPMAARTPPAGADIDALRGALTGE